MAKLKNVVAGAALGTLLGSIALALYPKRFEIMEALLGQSNQFGGKTKEYEDHFFRRHKKENSSQPYLTCLAGIILGAGVTLFLTPHSGRHLRAQVIKAFHALADKKMDGFHPLLKNDQQPTEVAPPTQTKPRKRVVKK